MAFDSTRNIIQFEDNVRVSLNRSLLHELAGDSLP